MKKIIIFKKKKHDLFSGPFLFCKDWLQWHGVKVGPGPGTRDPPQSLKVGPQDPLQNLKVGPQDPLQSLKVGHSK